MADGVDGWAGPLNSTYVTPRWKVATKWRGVPPGVGTNSAARQNSSTIHTPLGVSISPPKLRED